MRNRPTSIFESGSSRGGGSAFDVDAEPGVRLAWLFVAMTLPLLAVAGRLIHLQGFVAEGFAVEARHETESIEPIPARNGRILSSDGTVLAFDDERHQLLVHYRWLEEPPNEIWLRHEAMSRLSRSERRDKAKVERAKAEVLARRNELWRSLSELTEQNEQRLADQRQRIQFRVERILRLVEDRVEARRVEKDEPTRSASEGIEQQDSEDPSLSLRASVERAWNAVKHELTTTPTRERREPLRIPEQSDYHLLLDDVSSEVVAEIETHPDQYPGVRSGVTSRRIYPHGRVAPHWIGYRGEIGEDELKARRERFPNGDPLDYQPGDSVGRSGIEQSYEHELRGVRGQRRIIRDRHGTIVRSEVVRSPKPGRDVVLNLSVALQERTTSLLEDVLSADSSQAENVPPGGCIVAIDVQSGAILAAATAPTFDVNDFLSGNEVVRQALNEDPRRPMFPRATQMELPPGSVFKTVSAVAVLQSHRIDPDHQIECVGYLKEPNKLRCYSFTHFGHGHYGTDLTKAIAQSCNVYFFKAAQTLGPQPLVHWADEFGFGERTGVDVPGERRGHVPRPPEKSPSTRSKTAVELVSHERHAGDDAVLRPASPWDDREASRSIKSPASKREPWYDGDTLGLAIGQSRLTVTPLQIARMMAAVANDGWLVEPHVAREINGAFEGSTSTTQMIEPNRRRLPDLSEATLARVREGLEQVVAHPQGTGFKYVRLKEVAIAGKTGTAEITNRPDHAWFAGYVPADRPRIAFVVVLEQAGSGGKVAGPVAKKFVQSLLELGFVRGNDKVTR